MCQFEQIIGNNAENNGIFLRGVISAPSGVPFSAIKFFQNVGASQQPRVREDD